MNPMASNSIDGAIKERRILYPGKELPKFPTGTKVTFHFKTEYTCKGKKIIVDDSRALKKPMELILGKEFKLQIWEELLKTMCVEEVSQFVIDKVLLINYPYVSSVYRKFANYPIKSKLPPTSGGCCGKMMKTGLGYDDLDQLLAEPHDLTFTFELLKVEQPTDYTKELWQMDDQELRNKVIEFKEEGNKNYLAGKFQEAEKSYLKGLALIEKLLIKEVPKSSEYEQLSMQQIPFWLNLAQLKLKEKDFYAVITYCDKVLQLQPDNVKAYYRRAKANGQAWNQVEAKKDYAKAIELDVTLSEQIAKELEKLDIKCKKVEQQEKETLKQKLFHFD